MVGEKKGCGCGCLVGATLHFMWMMAPICHGQSFF